MVLTRRSNPPHIRTIQDLSLRGNYLGAEGLAHLAPALAETRSLLRLDLAGTGIGRPVIESIHGWSTAKVLRLENQVQHFQFVPLLSASSGFF